MKYFLSALVLSGLLLSLSGCGPAIVAGVATTGVMLHDKRTSATILEDKSIVLKGKELLRKNPEMTVDTHIVLTSYNKNLLIVGQVPSQAVSNQIETLLNQVDEVKKVYNELSIAQPTDLSTRSNDSWITTKIKSASMYGKNGVDPLHIKVVTENSVVYLMGIVSRQEADQATELARQVEGVKRVVRVFEYTD